MFMVRKGSGVHFFSSEQTHHVYNFTGSSFFTTSISPAGKNVDGLTRVYVLLSGLFESGAQNDPGTSFLQSVSGHDDLNHGFHDDPSQM
tara:strand:+ start:586 stop:852 length:267 start_codon:yes stop_codon:yes gene_type:complete